MKLAELAVRYNMRLEDVMKTLEEHGIFVLTVNGDISGEKLDRYNRILAEKAGSPTSIYIPDGFAKKVTTTVKQGSARQHDPASKKRLVPSGQVQPNSPDQLQKEMLSRDFVIFTHMALRKPVTAEILRQAVQYKLMNNTMTQIVICSGTIQEVQESAKKISKLEGTSKALDLLKQYGMLTILPGRVSAENHTISIFLKEKVQPEQSVLIVGYNRALSTYVNFRNSSNKSNPSYKLIFEKDVTSKGFLANPGNQMKVFEDPAGKPTAPYSTDPTPIHGGVPKTGEPVFVRQKDKDGNVSMVSMLLESEVSRGAEGAIYKVQSGEKCAKLFFGTSNCEMKMKKIELMCSKFGQLRAMDPLTLDHIGWPEKMLYNASGEPVGYLMAFFDGTVPFSHFNSGNFDTLIPDCDKTHQVTMAVNFSSLIDFLHHNNVILCDINRGNVLIDPKEIQVYLVDLDSAQFVDKDYCYPSNVAVPEFLSPEHIYDKDFTFLRKKADDIWIMQMLLFHMLTPDGEPMQSSEDVDDDRDLIRRGLYPYQGGKHRAEEDIRGTVEHQVVSRFPSYVKEMFWESFNGKGKYFSEKYTPAIRADPSKGLLGSPSTGRRNARSWLSMMVRYQNDLPQMIRRDPEDGKLRPEGYRKYDQPNTVKIQGGSIEELIKHYGDGSSNTPWSSVK